MGFGFGGLRFLLILILAATFTGCQARDPGGQSGTSLTVFAAASLTEVMEALGAEFEATHPGVDVVVNIASSYQLAQQLQQGAPADVFASANQAQMETVVAGGRVDEAAVVIFAQNQLALVAPAGNPAHLSAFQDLANPGLRLVIADENVPVGAYSRRVLEKARAHPNYGEAFYAAVLKNIVSYEETVRAVLTKVTLGEADAGFVYTSDLVKPDLDPLVRIPIPPELNLTTAYYLAPLNDARRPQLASQFIQLVHSPQGIGILEQFGFSAP